MRNRFDLLVTGSAHRTENGMNELDKSEKREGEKEIEREREREREREKERERRQGSAA